MNRHFMILLNPVSGVINKYQTLKKIETYLSQAGATSESFFTERRGHASDLAGIQLDRSFTDLMIVGGDGTLNEAINGLKLTEIPISIIPTGTGNDFVKSINVGKTLKQQVDTAINGTIKSLDVGVCNDRLFINCFGFGFDGKVVEEMERKGKQFGGHLAYLYTVLRIIATFQEPTAQFEIDGETFERKVFLMAINNGTTYGGGFPITPSAKMDDGLLDICLMNAMPLGRRFVNLPMLQLGKHEKLKEIQMLKTSKVSVKANSQIVAHVDGELIGNPPFEISVKPNYLKVRSN